MVPEGGIREPRGFSSKFVPTLPSRRFITKDLYSSTLHALLHYSLEDYEDPAAIFDTRGPPHDPSTVMIHAIPRTVPWPAPLNKHMAWALYYSVIAFNNPANTRELLATVFLYDKLVGSIDYRKTSPVLSSAQGPGGNATANMAQLLQDEDNHTGAKALSPPTQSGFSLRWMPVPGGAFIRRETAYDTVAYAILCTAPLSKDTRLIAKDRVAVPGGHVFLKIDPGPRESRWGTMAVGTIAQILPQIPRFLEHDRAFHEAAFEYVAPDGSYAGSVGIYVRTHTAGDPSNLLDRNATSSTGNNSTAARSETA
ncbi:MAG: hypothetical protein LQ350_007403 [Teloschistes chrysophthalmus]|nr:MAG: hypothetical protein LQ350_007403 [Niorma chrysophthalma]